MQAKGLNAWQPKTIATVAMAIPHAVPDSPGLLRSGPSGQLELHRRHLDSGLRPVPEGPGKKMGLLRLLPHPSAGPAPAPCGAVKSVLRKPPSPAKTEREAFVVPITTCPFHTQKWRSKRLPCTGEPSARKGRQRVCSLPGLACLLAWRKKPRRENSVLSGGAVLFIWYSRGPATSRNHSGPPYLCSVSLRWGRRIQTRRRRNSRCTNPPLG